MAEVTQEVQDSGVGINIDPALIPDKFGGDLNKFVQSYSELERKLGANTTETTTEQVPTTDVDGSGDEVPPTTTDTKQETTTEVEYSPSLVSSLQTVELTPQQVATEWESEGGVTDDTMTKLSSVFGEDLVKSYFAGLEYQKTQAVEAPKQAEASAVEAVGEEAWTKIVEWSSTETADNGLVDMYNTAIDKGDANLARAVALALKSSYESSFGTIAPQSVTKGAPAASNSSGVAFQSEAQMLEAMRDPRYSTDSAYRASVEKRIAGMAGITYQG